MTAMESGSLEKFVAHFSHKLSILKNALMLSDATLDEEYEEVSENLDSTLDSLQSLMKSLRRQVEQQKKHMEHVEDIKNQTVALSEHVRYAVDNIPTKLPAKKAKSATAPNVSAPPLSQQPDQIMTSQTSVQRCTYLEFLTVEQFDAVPKYMKGRMTYEKVNSVIEKLDHVYVEKYKILKQKKLSLNDVNRKRYEAFRRQETKDTQGVEFVVERDISDFSSLKIDNALRKILTILRHCCLIYEIRGEGHVRFAIVRGYYY
ncbi:spindle and kinetochore-associated protein 1 [Aplysia californica]|uniref:SKA complex subunit 1 n=1 Tax=Aplysia californica TaxID=6500 RepID=A0ABM0JC25_APLCA|nr:spindle and kinetochore-associated protein 1 [Aplysia californica]XP_005090217.1 spindle and kinetochore-associated protein 1 [Aplysia californica]XP_035826606.1 spindle and kinetochore-associated protein 1 [Aplysia californica]